MNQHPSILQTIQWIQSVVIGCNFCPFAAQAMTQNRVRFVALPDTSMEHTLEAFVAELLVLNRLPDIETTLMILPNHYADFEEYLDLVDIAEALLEEQGYEGVYQVASFHPEFTFEGTDDDDAANYTNRSPHPMLHILREDSITQALEHYPNPERIPERNEAYARSKGLAYMKNLYHACLG